MELSKTLVTESRTDSKGNSIESSNSNVTNIDVNVDASLVPIEQQNDDLELHLSNQKLRTDQDCKFPKDEAIDDTLPKGFSIFSAETFGNSMWTITGKLVARSSNSEKVFFVKTAYEETGKVMLHGEFESSKTIYELMPDFIPKPFGYGKYKNTDTPTYFYMSEFVDFDTTTAQDPSEFCERLADMHQKSQILSEKFGFGTTTCDGDRPHVVEWESDWAVFYRKLFLHTLSLDIERNGIWAEYERAAHQVAGCVIPRLLGKLTWNGQPIKPSLIHGDLWEGNAGINKETNLPMLFDAGSYFAHNEMELGHWACEFSAIFGNKVYTDHYLEFFPKAEPASEFEDRIRLYSLKGGMNYSAGHPNSRLRMSMLYLCEKYAPIDGIGQYEEENDPIKTGARIVSHQEIR